MPSRRAVIAALGLAPLSGCSTIDQLGGFVGGPRIRGPTRGENPVELSARMVEHRNEVELLDSGEVRYYKSYLSPDPRELHESVQREGEVITHSIPWEDWAYDQSIALAALEADRYVRDRQEGGGFRPKTGSISQEGRSVPILRYWPEDDRDRSDRVGSFEDLVAIAPKTVHTAYVLGGREFTTVAPLYVLQSTRRKYSRNVEGENHSYLSNSASQ